MDPIIQICVPPMVVAFGVFVPAAAIAVVAALKNRRIRKAAEAEAAEQVAAE